MADRVGAFTEGGDDSGPGATSADGGAQRARDCDRGAFVDKCRAMRGRGGQRGLAPLLRASRGRARRRRGLNGSSVGNGLGGGGGE